MKYLITSVILVSSFIILSLIIISGNSEVMKWDNSSFKILNNPKDKIINEIMVGFTNYGREVVWIAATILLFIFGKKEGRNAAVLLAMTFLILIPLGSILKTEIDRSRPIPISDENLLIKNEKDSSFPSGHALIVFGGATILLLRFNKRKQLISSVILAIESILVAYSRIYVGNHYPLDVVGGLLLGAGVACFIIYLSNYMGPIFTRLDSMKKN
jgi:membrane-associated phospholipid phosphatase